MVTICGSIGPIWQYLRISDHCRVTVRVRVRNMVRVKVSIRVRVGVADCCIQTAGKVTKCRSMT